MQFSCLNVSFNYALSQAASGPTLIMLAVIVINKALAFARLLSSKAYIAVVLEDGYEQSIRKLKVSMNNNIITSSVY